jgi:hypothetical protein
MHQAWVMRILDIAKAYGALRGVSHASNWSVGGVEQVVYFWMISDMHYRLA